MPLEMCLSMILKTDSSHGRVAGDIMLKVYEMPCCLRVAYLLKGLVDRVCIRISQQGITAILIFPNGHTTKTLMTGNGGEVCMSIGSGCFSIRNCWHSMRRHEKNVRLNARDPTHQRQRLSS
tara:strand:+ start:116 stop:481 length:366 start_codon:yes stop_codon:yes gene_type:complete